MSLYPSFEAIKNQIDNDQLEGDKLFHTRKSVRSILSHMLLFFIAAAIVIAVNIIFPNTNLIGHFFPKFYFSSRWLAIIPTLFFLEALRQYHDDLYEFTVHNLTHYDGRLSLNYAVPNIRYVDIRAVIMYQDIFGRILDYGDIEIDTAAQDKTEMYLEGIRSPKELADLIENLRDYSKKLAKINNPSYDAKEFSQD